jgi:hypothetical protein
LKKWGFLRSKILKIFKKQQQQMDPPAGKNTIVTEFVVAASSHKHPRAQKKISPDTLAGGQRQRCILIFPVFLRVIDHQNPPYGVSATA